MKCFLKKWSKYLVAFIFFSMYYSIVQFAHAASYVATEKAIISTQTANLTNFICYIFLFVPVIILIGRHSIKNTKVVESLTIQKYLMLYLIYIIILYLIRKNIIVGFYSINIYTFGIYIRLSESFLSSFVMAYIYILFHSVTSTIFFAVLPGSYLLVKYLNPYIAMKWKHRLHNINKL